MERRCERSRNLQRILVKPTNPAAYLLFALLMDGTTAVVHTVGQMLLLKGASETGQ